MNSNLAITKLESSNESISLSTELKEKLNEYGRLGLQGAYNTQRAYKADLKNFNEWCDANGQVALPASPETLAGYVAHLADNCKWATINRRLAAISKLHQLQNLETPTQNRVFRTVMEGIKRANGIRQKQAPAFKLNKLKSMLREIETDSNAKLRDKALLLLGFTGAFRRSELVALNVEDLQFTEEGLIVSMKKSKTNQYGDYEEKAIFYSPEAILCPIRTLQSWIQRLEKNTDALFVRVRKGDKITEDRLTDKTVNDLVKTYLGEEFSAHSLRASFITIAKINGADDSEIMRQSKHKTSAMIQRYTRIEDIKQHNAAMKLGL
ncbi:site-specific recombinase XerD [Arcicella aurantiaca]|uniref:Site-specific recombinase XerD n=1 Tax=Arcicella aurantiaca TaxID=591202 RepID=A0A316ED20_9BACT|nr:site-specific integrase [Arcicella aurantiaca]PWK27529.1 site-specific recombinase XerD [Arcicella aurantiaca]